MTPTLKLILAVVRSCGENRPNCTISPLIDLDPQTLFTDRQRIKRKAETWGKRYHALPRAEHLAILSLIMAVEAGETV